MRQRDLITLLSSAAAWPLAVRWKQGTSSPSSGGTTLTACGLGGLAEFERELIRARTGEGRSRAKARGVRFGRQ